MFFFLLLLVGAVPFILVAVAPPRWVRAAVGWSILLIGLSAIDARTATPFPYDDDFLDVGIGSAFAFLWSIALAAGAAFRHRALLADQESGSAFAKALRSWQPPVAGLLAIAFHHWLSNRLAGASPADQAHLVVAGAAAVMILALAVAWRLGGRIVRILILLPTVFAAAMMLLVVRDWAYGSSLWSEGRRQAAGRPYCMMTYGGFQHRRQAIGAWDLSPLVNRLYANWAAKKAPALVVDNGSGLVSYRWIGRWREVANQPDTCRPSHPDRLRPPV